MCIQKISRIAFIFTILVLLMWPLSVMRAAVPATADQAQLPTSLSVLTSDKAGLDFTLDTSAFVQLADGRLAVDGLTDVMSSAGAPALPYWTATIIVPPAAEVSVQVSESAVSSQPVSMIPPAPQAALPDENMVDDGLSPYALVDEAGEVIGYATPDLAYVADTAVYAQDALYPQAIYELSDPAYLRDFRLVELRLYPIRYNPASGSVTQAQAMHVQVTFNGADWENLRPSPSHGDTFGRSLSHALNYKQGQHWRSLPPADVDGGLILLPVGVPVYKIEIDRDGIYELTGADFAAAGMNIASFNPNSLQMLYRGQPMAYQLIGSNGDNDFDAAEKIRFYGWAFEGSRTDKQFVSNNVLWVWAGGTPTYMSSQANEAGSGYTVDTNYLAEITREPENTFFPTWTRWDTFPNEPDAWFWDYIVKPISTIVTRTYTVTLPHPEPTGPDATYLIEFHARRTLTNQPHIVRARINNDADLTTLMWQEPNSYAHTNINLVDNNVPISALNNGTNALTVGYATATNDQLYLNRITVEYMRQLVADADQLVFQDEIGGAREFHVASFNEGNAANALVWDISVPTSTVEIEMDSADIVANGGMFTYKIGRNHAAGAQYLATTAANILTASDLAANISQYVPPSLDPAGNTADWLAISHADLLSQAQDLANHRADPDFGDMTTWVVDIEDVINQYGYGLPLPQSVQAYLRHALLNWTVAPSYVTLFGDATQNPRYLACAHCTAWDKDEENMLLTDLPFVDRYQGLIPSDLTFVLLSGNDLLADMAIGRIAAKTPVDASSVVDKIVEFEMNQFDETAYDWQRNNLFVADNLDPDAGDFCAANASTGTILPPVFNQIHLCLPGVDGTNPPTPQQVNELRVAMSQTVNITGTTMLNYRGHGAVERWGNFLLTTDLLDFWQNNGRPLMILSADCLDGHFAASTRPGMGEAILKLNDRGSAAHWSSSGLGLTSEHSILHRGFYNGVFEQGLTAIGDAVNYSKLVYLTNGQHESEAYSFNLQGDPAMQLYRPDLTIDKQVVQTEVEPGDPVDFVLTVSNQGLYPTHVVVTDTLPTDLTFVTMTASVPLTNSHVVGNQIVTELLNPLAWGESAVITVTAQTPADFIGVTTNLATAVGTGYDLDMANNTDSAQAASTIPSVVLATYTATPLDNEVQLDWQVSLEVDIDAYKVTRSEAGGPFIWLQNLGNNGYIPAQGNAPVDYQVFDTTAENGRTYEYRLLAVQTNSSEVDLGVREVTLPPYAALVNFNAVPLADEVLLTWEVSSEFEVAAYTIERGQNGNFIWLDGLGDNGYILATGDINTEANYSVRDKTAVNGQTYTYRLIAHESVTPGGKTAVVATRTVTLDSSRTIYMPVTIRP